MKVTEVVLQGKFLRLGPVNLAESVQLRLNRLYPKSLYKPAVNVVLVAIPAAQTWGPSTVSTQMGDTSLLAWVTEAINNLVVPKAPTKASTS